MKPNAEQIRQEALDRAQHGQSLTNYPAIIAGFLEKGIPEADILPRENVFTFQAWKALGRVVRRGEHGVKVHTFVPMGKDEKDDETGEVKHKAWKAARTTTVFHVSQTDPLVKA